MEMKRGQDFTGLTDSEITICLHRGHKKTTTKNWQQEKNLIHTQLNQNFFSPK
jgi:hypothetical protein